MAQTALNFDAIRVDAQRKRLSRRNDFLFPGPVGHYTRHFDNLGNPAPVCLKFRFDFVNNVRHACILARSHFCRIKVWLDLPNITRRI